MKISLVVVSIKNAGNLGALARLCNNYDIMKLILVNPQCEIDDEAYERATWGRPYLDNAIVIDNLELAREHVDTLIALSARIGGYNSLSRSSFSIINTSQQIGDFDGHLGIVLGPEDFGLSNQELDSCDFLCHIPLLGENQVLNISHAASIALWELTRGKIPEKSVDREDEPLHILLSSAKKKVLFEYLDEILPHSWIKDENFDGIKTVFRQVFGRSFVTEREGNAIVGTFRGIHKTLIEGHPHWDNCKIDE
ncbi:MAG: RNA methyltransferase [Candidatus Heimdallarchaeota archaeon]